MGLQYLFDCRRIEMEHPKSKKPKAEKFKCHLGCNKTFTNNGMPHHLADKHLDELKAGDEVGLRLLASYAPHLLKRHNLKVPGVSEAISKPSQPTKVGCTVATPPLLPLPPRAPSGVTSQADYPLINLCHSLLQKVEQIEQEMLIKDRKLNKIENELVSSNNRINKLEEQINILKSKDVKTKYESSEHLDIPREKPSIVSSHIKKDEEEYGEKIARVIKTEVDLISVQIKQENVELEEELFEESCEIEKNYATTEPEAKKPRLEAIVKKRRLEDAVAMGRKPYMCQVCTYSSDPASNLERHIRTVHVMEKPYIQKEN